MTVHAIDQTVTALTEIDATIERISQGALTLDPNRSRATPLSDVVGELADSTQHPQLAAAACAVAEAQIEAFPQNLLWDFDYYLASLHAQAREAPDYGAHLREATGITVGLMRLYGQHSTIRFQYVHDFMYGFDWARWVRRDQEARSRVEPFSLEFLRQSDRRGRDILRLIESDDEVYPKLSGAGPRNPFPFVRAPDEELRLYRSLAERSCIPVEAWRVNACPDASRDFDELREEAARRLGLGR
jgi:hypothetical protein